MLDHVFQPLTVKGVTIPNRFVVAPMVTNYCDGEGKATERYIRYHEAKAEGGFGLIITEDYAVDPCGRGFKHVAGMWDDSQIESHTELTKRVHKHGAKIFAQFYHCGRQTTSAVIGEAPVAPSPIPDPFSTEVPRELTIPEIEKIIQQFADTAVRLKKCGFDGVQFHGAHGYLLSEFMSPYANKRTDEYGGNFTNRMRFPLAVIRKVRESVGDDFVLDYRLSGDEFVRGGRTISDTKAIVPLLVDAGLDMIHITATVYGSINRMIPPQSTQHADFAELAAEVKKITNIPVTNVCRVNDPYIAEELIASGTTDLVAMARASLCDPALPRKAKEGRFEDIRHCIACNIGCTGELFAQRSVACALNPTLGFEYRQPEGKAETIKDVAIIGGGPAGMQAAISAAERGHKVTLYEKEAVLGGQYRVASMPPAKGELAAFLNWQETQMKKLNVEVKLNTSATANSIGKADAVILATGATVCTPKIPGINSPHVVQANDVLMGRVFPGRNIVIIGGGQVGAETADYLIQLGRKVTILEMFEEIAPKEETISRAPLIKSLRDGDVAMHTCTKATSISETAVTTADGRAFAADMVIIAVGVKSENSLKAELEAAGHTVYVVGDAKEPRDVMKATSEAHETAIIL